MNKRFSAEWVQASNICKSIRNATGKDFFGLDLRRIAQANGITPMQGKDGELYSNADAHILWMVATKGGETINDILPPMKTIRDFSDSELLEELARRLAQPKQVTISGDELTGIIRSEVEKGIKAAF